jgi:hypothetical protein
MNKIYLLIAIIVAFFFIVFIKLNNTHTKSFSLHQKEFRKGRIAC